MRTLRIGGFCSVVQVATNRSQCIHQANEVSFVFCPFSVAVPALASPPPPPSWLDLIVLIYRLFGHRYIIPFARRRSH